MATKKPEEIRKTKNPDGSTEVQYTDGTVVRTNLDGSKDLIDASGKSLTKLSIIEVQIEAWKKMPDDEALKEGLRIFRMENMDVPEARLRLEVLRFLCEIRGVMQQKTENTRMPPIMIQVNMPGQPFQKTAIDITAKQV